MNLNERLKGAFSSPRKIILLLLLVLAGVALIMLSSLADGEQVGDGELTLAEYKATLEEELADVCSRVGGVGRCRVVLTFERGEENVYKGSLLEEQRPPKVMGVSIVCEGGSDASVKVALSDMMSSLFGIGRNRISVLEMKK